MRFLRVPPGLFLFRRGATGKRACAQNYTKRYGKWTKTRWQKKPDFQCFLLGLVSLFQYVLPHILRMSPSSGRLAWTKRSLACVYLSFPLFPSPPSLSISLSTSPCLDVAMVGCLFVAVTRQCFFHCVSFSLSLSLPLLAGLRLLIARGIEWCNEKQFCYYVFSKILIYIIFNAGVFPHLIVKLLLFFPALWWFAVLFSHSFILLR